MVTAAAAAAAAAAVDRVIRFPFVTPSKATISEFHPSEEIFP